MQGNTGREQKETKTKIGRKIKKSNQQAMAGFAVQGELSNHTFTSGCGHGWREPTRLTCSEAGVNDPLLLSLSLVRLVQTRVRVGSQTNQINR